MAARGPGGRKGTTSLTGAASSPEEALLSQQEVLARFGELALRSHDLQEILDEACRLVGEALSTDLAKVLELQDDGTTLLVKAGVGWPPGVVGQVQIVLREGSSEGHALETGDPVISTDIESETRFEYAGFIKDAGVKALANVIILGPRGKPPYGVLQVDSRHPREFVESDISFLRSYANLLAASVERLRTVSELRRSEDHYRAAVELNPQIAWTADADGLVTGFSERWLELTGLTREQALGSGWVRTPHPEDRSAMEAAWAHAVATGEPYDVEARVRHADGAFRWLRVRAVPRRDEAGRILGWYGTTEDIEDRRRLEAALRQWNETLEARVAERTRALELEQREREAAEEKLRQSQKMEAVGQLTGGLAHDFNNLLTGIIGGLELLQTRVNQGRTADLERYVTAAMTSATRAGALTHRLLAFARRQTLDPKLIQPNRLVAGMEDLLRQTVGPAITVETVLPADVRPILCDPNQLESALLNLTINARDAMPAGGKLRIETANASVNALFATQRDMPPGEYAALSVTDTGSGMSPAVVARAFDPFFTTKPLGMGTGLGLSMIYGFAQQSGGQVRIHSKEGVGTTVSIYLPQHDGETEAEAPLVPAAMPRATAGQTVLVVDDEAVVRLLVVEVLQDLGYQPIEAVDGASGLRQVERHPHLDLLVTDVGLPGGMNGRQLADAARVGRPDLKVLFITGFTEAAVIGDRALGSGMEVMTKPFELDALASRIQDLTSRA